MSHNAENSALHEENPEQKEGSMMPKVPEDDDVTTVDPNTKEFENIDLNERDEKSDEYVTIHTPMQSKPVDENCRGDSNDDGATSPGKETSVAECAGEGVSGEKSFHKPSTSGLNVFEESKSSDNSKLEGESSIEYREGKQMELQKASLQSKNQTVDPVMKEIEEAAAVAAVAAKEAANIAQQKITRGVAEAKAFMSSLWSFSLDGSDSGRRSAKGSLEAENGDERMRQHLGLESDEVVLEEFRCKILQRYHPIDNDFTQTKVIAFSGHFTIASASVVFELDSAAPDGQAPVRVPRSDIVGFSRDDNGQNKIILQLINGRQMILGQFRFPDLELDSCIALLEQLVKS